MKKIIPALVLVIVLSISECPVCGSICGHSEACGLTAEDVQKPVEEVEDVQEEQEVEKKAEMPLYDVPLPYELQEYIYQCCESNNISYELILALIEVESNFNSEAISETDDWGLMQINAINHKDGYDYLDPYDNVKHGIKSIARLSKKYIDVEPVCMAYNLGEAGAMKLWEQGIYSTEYSKKVYEAKIKWENQTNT